MAGELQGIHMPLKYILCEISIVNLQEVFHSNGRNLQLNKLSFA